MIMMMMIIPVMYGEEQYSRMSHGEKHCIEDKRWFSLTMEQLDHRRYNLCGH